MVSLFLQRGIILFPVDRFAVDHFFSFFQPLSSSLSYFHSQLQIFSCWCWRFLDRIGPLSLWFLDPGSGVFLWLFHHHGTARDKYRRRYSDHHVGRNRSGGFSGPDTLSSIRIISYTTDCILGFYARYFVTVSDHVVPPRPNFAKKNLMSPRTSPKFLQYTFVGEYVHMSFAIAVNCYSL